MSGAYAVPPSRAARTPPGSNARPPRITGVPVPQTASISRRTRGREDESEALTSTARGPRSMIRPTTVSGETLAPR